jgi:xanthine dehydrogenase accessory factor
MGSRRTHVERLERLRTARLTDTELSGLSSPVGLDLRARRPEETAVSIAAEIIAARSGGSGARLRDLDQPIHQRAVPVLRSPSSRSVRLGSEEPATYASTQQKDRARGGRGTFVS